MIVVDVNVIAYLFLPGNNTRAVERLLRKEPEWASPLLWRSEFTNVLCTYLREELVDRNTALSILSEAQALMNRREYLGQADQVLDLAAETGCSAYDCEYASLARELGVRLATFDTKLLKAFPKQAFRPQ